MRLVCPNCDAQYEIDAAVIPAAGRDVQCSNCGKTWFQSGPGAETPEVEPAGPSDDGLSEEAKKFFSREDVSEAETGPDVEPEPEAEPETEPVAEPETNAKPEPEPEPEPQEEPETEAAPAGEAAKGDETAADDENWDAALVSDPSPDTQDAVADTPEDAWYENAEKGEPAPTPGPDEPEEVKTEPAPDASAGAAAAEPEKPEAEDGEDAGPSPAEARPRPEIDAAVLGILKAEAEREIAARRAEEAEALEAQPDLGLASPDSSADEQIEARTARLRGQHPEPEAAQGRKTVLPDIDEINSTLTATSDRVTGEDTAPVQVQKRRSGFRVGFAALMLATAALIILYLYAPVIGRLIPALEPALASYVDWANGMRLAIDGFLQRSVDSLTGLLMTISE